VSRTHRRIFHFSDDHSQDRILFDPHTHLDGLTTMDCLPMVLSKMDPDCDGLYTIVLQSSEHLLHFLGFISTFSLAQQPLSVATIADLLGISSSLTSLESSSHWRRPRSRHTLAHVPARLLFLGITLRGGFANPNHHRRLACRCILSCLRHPRLSVSLRSRNTRHSSPNIIGRHFWGP
jgi:hypothetical protein